VLKLSGLLDAESRATLSAAVEQANTNGNDSSAARLANLRAVLHACKTAGIGPLPAALANDIMAEQQGAAAQLLLKVKAAADARRAGKPVAAAAPHPPASVATVRPKTFTRAPVTSSSSSIGSESMLRNGAPLTAKQLLFEAQALRYEQRAKERRQEVSHLQLLETVLSLETSMSVSDVALNDDSFSIYIGSKNYNHFY
jgi:hypothetical protein